MGFKICKTFEVESGHMLSKHPDKCKFPHGHTRKIEFILSSPSLDENEMVCDFKVIKELIGDFLTQLDHSMCMNTEDPAFSEFVERYGDNIIPFKNQDPTTELIAQYIFNLTTNAIQAHSKNSNTNYSIRSNVTLESVRVWETSSSWSEYSN